jgi:hypothetical protein
MEISLREDLDSVGQILNEAFELEPFKRDYDRVFGRIAKILSRYGINDNARNLRFTFILCMQEFFDGVPQDKWRLRDPAFIKESERVAIAKFREWVIQQVT